MTVLNEKQKRFISEYMVDQNATRAAIRAGYSQRSAGQLAGALMKKHEIKDEIDRRLRRQAELTEDRAAITQEWVVAQVAKLYESCAQRVPVLDRDGQPEVGDDGRVLTKLVDATNANAALEKLMKHTGAYERDHKRELDGGIRIVWGDDADSDDPV